MQALLKRLILLVLTIDTIQTMTKLNQVRRFLTERKVFVNKVIFFINKIHIHKILNTVYMVNQFLDCNLVLTIPGFERRLTVYYQSA